MSAPHDTLLGHNALGHRALVRLLERLQTAAAEDPTGATLRRGIAAAVTALRAHHTGEDEVLVPFLRARAGTTEALAALHTDHERVAAAIARLERAPAADLADAVGQVLRTFADHCTREEALFAALPWGTLATSDEVRTVGKALSDHARRHLRPAYVQLPLLLFNLDPDERRAFTDRMPSVVGRLVVPWVFRPGWRHLRPFLTHAPRPVLSRAGGAGIR